MKTQTIPISRVDTQRLRGRIRWIAKAQTTTGFWVWYKSDSLFAMVVSVHGIRSLPLKWTRRRIDTSH